jgi:hypothetical protein
METLLMRALVAAIQAGMAVLEVYRSDFSVIQKSDDSPLTMADKRSHEMIEASLKPLGLPLLSEEGRNIPFSERKTWETFSLWRHPRRNRTPSSAAGPTPPPSWKPLLMPSGENFPPYALSPRAALLNSAWWRKAGLQFIPD